MNKYEKMMQALQNDIDREYSEYYTQGTQLYNRSNEAVHKYNDQINVINSLRQSLNDDILVLYKFLKRFGDVGERISPFDFVTEDSKFVNNNTAGRPTTQRTGQNDTSGFVPKAMLACAAVAPQALPILLCGSALNNRSKSKKEYQTMLCDFETEKTKWEKDLAEAGELVRFYKDATEIANIYRALIASVRLAIRETIIPELTGIDTFLTADAIKNCIISGMDPNEAEIASISLYKGTAYDMHYTFVRNVFDYYTILVAFFTRPILTNIVKDNKVTAEEKNGFNDEVNQIKEQTKLLESSAVFGGAL